MALRKLFDHLGSYNKAYKNWQVERDQLDRFVVALADFLKETKQGDSEETIKSDFDKYVLSHFHKTSLNKDRADLVVEEDGKTAAIFEFKRPGNKNEMVTESDVDRKSLHEAIWYFYNQEDMSVSRNIKTIVITDTEKFFFFDPKAFWDESLKHACLSYKANAKSYHKTDQLYAELSEIIKGKDIVFDYAIFDLYIYRGAILSGKFSDDDRAALANFYKALHANFMLRHFKQNDSNELDREFYGELLYIVGLEERTAMGGKRTLVQSDTEGSIFDLIMRELDSSIEDKFEAALQLSIVWLNRVLFLKIFEGLLVSANGGADEYAFFDIKRLNDFPGLNRFFFRVLGRPIADRKGEEPLIPYLNSALFEKSEAEEQYGLTIDGLNSKIEIAVMHSSAITKSMQTYPTKVPTLKYLLDFLGVHNFRSDVGTGDGKVKTINPSVLGLVFEKLNGYKDGSFYTPGFITEYMARRTIDRAVLSKFNRDVFSDRADCDDMDELKALLAQDSYKKDRRALYASIIDGLKVCDPACGSGHFLVSVLNYLVYLKYHLGLLNLGDSALSIEIQNDTLVIYDGEKQFEYRRGDKRGTAIQKKIFHEKETIIKQCLFGVDINPNSVNICRLRLWIELLKNTYYVGDEEGNMQILPNIDIKIAAGNSLLSNCQFAVGAHPRVVDAKRDTTKHVQMNVDMLARLKSLTEAYKGESDKKEKDRIRRELRTLKVQTFNYGDVYGETLEWPLEFPEMIDAEGRFIGFDIVIGNPPYISAPTMEDPANPKLSDMRKKIKQDPRYKTLINKWDIYVPFMELGMQMLREHGSFAMIVPFPLAVQNYGKNIRNMFVNEYDMYEISDLHEQSIFNEATVQNCIVFANKDSSRGRTDISCIDDSKKIEIIFSQKHDILVQDKKTAIWNLSNASPTIAHHSDMHVLGDYCYISVGMVLNAHEKLARGQFVKDDLICLSQDEIHCKKYIEGKDINTFVVSRVRYLEWGTNRCPNFVRRPTFPELYTQPKILVNTLGDIKAVIDINGEYYCNHKLYVILPWNSLEGVDNKSIDVSVKRYSHLSRAKMELLSKQIDVKYLVGILNSSYAMTLLSNLRGGDFNIYPEHIRNIPIAPATPEQQAEIAALVDEILAAKEADPNADISAQMAAIDEKVYKLYGVESPEIATDHNDGDMGVSDQVDDDTHARNIGHWTEIDRPSNIDGSLDDLKMFVWPSQEHLFDRLRREYDGRDVASEGKYLLVKGEAPIMLVAHLDTVYQEEPKKICQSLDGNILKSPQGIGGDDRCGVYALVQCYARSPIKPWLLFTCDEEDHGIGASEFAADHAAGSLPTELEELKFLVEIDRKGSYDAVYYECNNSAFDAYIEGKGFAKDYGTFTDICKIAPALGVAAVNLSSGYHNAHSHDEPINEQINISELNDVIESVLGIIADAARPETPRYEYIPQKF